jgi:energy-converting hydrogenase Eha subunit E
MAEYKNVGLLKAVLVIYVVVVLVYGVLYLFVPDFLVDLSGGAPVFPGWLRWSGGVLIALGVGAVLAIINPRNQGIFVTTLALGCLLAGLSLVWTWINPEEGAHLWFTAVPALVTLVLSGLLWWARHEAKDILYPK